MLYARRHSQTMDRKDVQSIVTLGGKYVNREVDLLGWINIMVVYGLIDEDTERDLRRTLTRLSRHGKNRFIVILREIIGKVTFDDFVNTLYKVNMSDFARELEQERYGRALTRMGRAEAPHARVIHTYYCNMKRNVDNGVFKNTLEYLVNEQNALKLKIRHSIDNSEQFNAEKLVAVYVLLLPQYSGYNKRKALLDDMKKFFHEPVAALSGSDRHLAPRVDANSADIVYASKMAVTTAIAGDFISARRFALEAECLGSLYKPSLASILAFHDHQYIFRTEFMKTGNRTCLGQVLSVGDRGLRSLADEDEDIRNQWSRLLMLYKTLSLLRITSDFQVTNVLPSPSDVEQAKEVLNVIQRRFTGIECRREMIYSLCVARTHENTDLDKAITYVNEAIRLSENCHSFLITEKPNIHKYLRSLKRKHLNAMLLNLLASLPLHVYAIVVGFLSILLWVIFH